MDKLKYKYVMEIRRNEEDGGNFVNVPMPFGNVIDIDFIFRLHPELKAITFKPANDEEGQTNDKD